MPPVPVPITITVVNEGINVTPTFANVKNQASVERIIRWRVVGGSFPTSGCFAWKGNPEGAPTAPVCPSAPGQTVIESGPYTNNFPAPGRVWQYKISVVVNGKTVTIDPEINNEPPSN